MILYNGATGGLGRYLAAPLSRLGLPSHPLTARLEDLPALREELDGLETSSPVTFIHLAALVSDPACEADPTAAYQINVELAHATTSVIVEWAFRRGVTTRVIFASTGHVYATQPLNTR